VRVVVVGAGFAGLLAAYRIAQAGHEVVVLEARDRVGGRVWSQELAPGDLRSVVERGGEFVLDGYDVMRTVVAELGLELADMTMSYYEREPRGAAMTTHQDMAQCAAVVATAAASWSDRSSGWRTSPSTDETLHASSSTAASFQEPTTAPRCWPCPAPAPSPATSRPLHPMTCSPHGSPSRAVARPVRAGPSRAQASSRAGLGWVPPGRLTVVLLRTTTYNSVMASMTVSEARAALPELLSRVEGGEEITITRHGRPAAVLVRPDALRSRRADAALEEAGRIHELLTQVAAEPLPEGPGLTSQRAEELIAAIRAGRDTR
jgi:prevent-host-death family protein